MSESETAIKTLQKNIELVEAKNLARDEEIIGLRAAAAIAAEELTTKSNEIELLHQSSKTLIAELADVEVGLDLFQVLIYSVLFWFYFYFKFAVWLV